MGTSHRTGAPIPQSPIEWPTLAVALGVHTGLGLVTYFFHALPWYVVLTVASYLTALHSSLQHEVLHGHPTRSAWFNEALISIPFALVYPYRRYKALHLRHHNDEYLTDPYEDPESYYRSQGDWNATPRYFKQILKFNNTAFGRLTLGPALTSLTFWLSELRLTGTDPRLLARPWLLHLAGMVPLFGWIVVVCDISVWEYVVFFAYPATSLILLRSFAEHQASEQVGNRTTIVDAAPIWGLLYLNNNLHFAHHKYPRAAWYRLPAIFRRERAAMLEENHGYLFNGYSEILGRYAFRPKETNAHPYV